MTPTQSRLGPSLWPKQAVDFVTYCSFLSTDLSPVYCHQDFVFALTLVVCPWPSVKLRLFGPRSSPSSQDLMLEDGGWVSLDPSPRRAFQDHSPICKQMGKTLKRIAWRLNQTRDAHSMVTSSNKQGRWRSPAFKF